MWQAGDQSRSEIPWLIIHCAHFAVKAPLSKPVLFKPARLPPPRLPALAAQLGDALIDGVNRHLVAPAVEEISHSDQ